MPSMPTFTIQHPLLIFYEVHRRTGTIERSCVFTNEKAESIQLDVRYDFPEHSWVQIYGSDLDGSVVPRTNGHNLTLKPGQNEVLLSFNTDNFNFPDNRFRGRISFKDHEDGDSEDWLEIHFEHIQELAPFPGYAAIDLGTSTATISLFHIRRDAVRRQPWTPKLDANATELPAAVLIRNFQKFIHHADGGCTVGRDALETFRTMAPRDPRCLQVSTKRLIGLSRILVADENESGGFVDPIEILHALGRFVRERAQNNDDVHAFIRKVSVTFPPTWSYHQISRWRQLFRLIGFKDEELDLALDEASAAGLFYIYNCVKDRDSLNTLIQDLLDSEEPVDDGAGRGYTLNLLSLDFGGGTMDLALIEARLELLPQVVRLRLKLVGSDSCDFGGDRVTLAIFRMLKRRLAMALSDPARVYEEHCGEEHETRSEIEEAAWLAPYAGQRDDEATFVLPDRVAARVPGSVLRGDAFSDELDSSRAILHENWGYLATHLHCDELETDLENAVEEFFPTRFLPSTSELFRPRARRNFDWLWEQAESLKKRLFNQVARAQVDKNFPAFDVLREVRRGISLVGAPDPNIEDAISWHDDPTCEEILSVGADEVYKAISEPLEECFAKARRLAGSKHLARVVLSGQSSRIPIVRWMFSRPRNEGGLGIPAAKIEFDDANAKAAVSKGACLLHVMRDTLVGFEIDIADFSANLLADIFYLQVDGSHRLLFPSGSIDDFSYVEESPDPGTFPKYLSVFHGSEENLAGQVSFDVEGKELPTFPDEAMQRGEGGAPSGTPPTTTPAPPLAELLELRDRDRSQYGFWATRLLKWSELQRIAWMESTASDGAPERPIYRYYLTRNHRLYVVRDRGTSGKRYFELSPDEPAEFGLDPRENPFSGIH